MIPRMVISNNLLLVFSIMHGILDMNSVLFAIAVNASNESTSIWVFHPTRSILVVGITKVLVISSFIETLSGEVGHTSAIRRGARVGVELLHSCVCMRRCTTWCITYSCRRFFLRFPRAFLDDQRHNLHDERNEDYTSSFFGVCLVLLAPKSWFCVYVCVLWDFTQRKTYAQEETREWIF